MWLGINHNKSTQLHFTNHPIISDKCLKVSDKCLKVSITDTVPSSKNIKCTVDVTQLNA